MKIRYFADTDTVYIHLNNKEITHSQELYENATVDLDADGNLVALTLEHAKETANILDFSFQQATESQLQFA